MPPKKKAPEVTGPSASNPSPLEQAGGGEDAGGGTGGVEQVFGPAASELAPRPADSLLSAPLPGGAEPAASWYPWYHTLAGPRSGRWVSRRSGPACAPACWNERGAAAWTGCCSF